MKKMKYVSRAVTGCFGIALLWFAAGPLMFSNWHTPLVHKPSDYGLAFESVAFQPPDEAITLRSWWLPSPGARAVIVMAHGAGDNKSHPDTDWLKLARDLVANGYSIIDLDLRNHGESDNSVSGQIGGGEDEANDVIGAINYAIQRGLGTRFGAIGYSLGGQAALYAAARDPRIEAVVEDGTYADDLVSIVPNFANSVSGLPKFLFKGPFAWSAQHLHRIPLDRGRAIDVVSSIAPRPVLLIHNEADAIIPAEHSRRLAAAYPKAQLWISPAPPPDNPFWRAGMHCRSYQLYPEEFVMRATTFLNASFASESPRVNDSQQH